MFTEHNVTTFTNMIYLLLLLLLVHSAFIYIYIFSLIISEHYLNTNYVLENNAVGISCNRCSVIVYYSVCVCVYITYCDGTMRRIFKTGIDTAEYITIRLRNLKINARMISPQNIVNRRRKIILFFPGECVFACTYSYNRKILSSKSRIFILFSRRVLCVWAFII